MVSEKFLRELKEAEPACTRHQWTEWKNAVGKNLYDRSLPRLARVCEKCNCVQMTRRGNWIIRLMYTEHHVDIDE